MKLFEAQWISDARISTSIWEGFILPIAEMQQSSVPVLAYNVAAHPEVIIDPWLCVDTQEIITKSIFIINNGFPLALQKDLYSRIFARNSLWDKVLSRWSNVIYNIEKSENPSCANGRRLVLITTIYEILQIQALLGLRVD